MGKLKNCFHLGNPVSNGMYITTLPIFYLAIIAMDVLLMAPTTEDDPFTLSGDALSHTPSLPTMIRTHPNFKTVVPSVNDAEGIDNCVGKALTYQFMFEKRTTPWEMKNWDYDELQKFVIIPEMIDRLYFIEEESNVGGSIYNLIVRVDYNGEFLYVELSASCDFTGFDCQGGGQIFISKDANLFMMLTLPDKDCEKDLIYNFLAEDGIQVEMRYEQDKVYTYTSFPMFRENLPMLKFLCHVPMLKYLCHEAVYFNKDILQGYASVMPKNLTDSLDDFIRTREAIIDYDNWE